MARSLLDKIGIDPGLMFIIVLFIGIPVCVSVPAMIGKYLDDSKELQLAELETQKSIATANSAQEISWIGIEDIRQLEADSLVINHDEDKGIHLLVAVTGAEVQSFYVKNSDVDEATTYISERNN